MKKFKKFVGWIVLALALFIAGCSCSAYAKDASLVVEFSFDKDFEVGITGYRLYYTKVPGSGVRVFITDIGSIEARVIDTPVFDLAPGKTTDFFLSAVSTDGSEAFSPAFPFKYTGKPFVISIRSKK